MASEAHVRKNNDNLVGVGLYTCAEAGRLLRLPPARIARWLKGYSAKGEAYEALWAPQVELSEEGWFLGFRDLQEVRVAAAFIAAGLSPQRVRRAIGLARDVVDDRWPLSTTRFRTDGRSVFLQTIADDGEAQLLDLFESQYAFREVIERSLSHLDYDAGGAPSRWWPAGRPASVVLDPHRSFGQPIEAESSIPVVALVSAVDAEGSIEAAARSFDVPRRIVTRALGFARDFQQLQAA